MLTLDPDWTPKFYACRCPEPLLFDTGLGERLHKGELVRIRICHRCYHSVRVSPYVLAEYGRDPSDRTMIEEVGVLELTPHEVASMNRQMVWSPCRILPAKWFVKML
jgi:hypothetical protein